MTKLNDIAQEIMSKKISLEEGGLKAMLLLYENKPYFGLCHLDRDTLHDFILFEYEHFLRIFKIFDPQKGKFSTFYISSFQNSLKAFIRQIARKNSITGAYESSKSILIEDQPCNYCQSESEQMMNICDDELFESSDYISGKTKNKKAFSSSQRVHHEEFRRTAYLILLLRSCFSLTDSMIRKISILTNVSEEKLLKMTADAKEMTWNKKEIRDKLEKSRDNAYFYRTKYQQEMQQIEDEVYKKSKMEKYLSHTKKWQERNNHLKELSGKIAPTNRTIGKILNIPTYKVGYILREIRKTERELSLVNGKEDEKSKFIDTKLSKQYNTDYENLPSNRQQKQKTGDCTNSPGTSDCHTCR